MDSKFRLVSFCMAVFVLSGITASAASDKSPLRVSDNRRFLVKVDGTPFFWLGDTAWEIFHRLNREEADAYLKNRASKGFNVIQAVALAELDGLHTPNVYGFTPLIGDDPTKPEVHAGPENDYWDHVDYVVKKANSLGLIVALLPTWGDKWNKKSKWAVGPEIFTPDNAEIYGRWIGERYKNDDIVWVLGGDRSIDTPIHREIIHRMAIGLKAGDGGHHLITLHPDGNRGSSDYFPDVDWIDFNFRQNGHASDFTYVSNYGRTKSDYDRTPVKPVIDGEPLYEDHPIAFKQGEFGHSVAADVRRVAYWDLFTGACGHTYGHHSVWQMWAPGRDAINDPLMTWREALDQPGAGEIQYARWLLESRPFLNRIPDPSLIVPDRVTTAVPGVARYHFTATRDTDGTYAMIYAPVGRKFTVRMEIIKNDAIKAWWYNPRNGEVRDAGTFKSVGEHTFLSPDPGEILDWILVLDDASKGYPAPGSRTN
jgi:hypothetical protein